MSIKQKILFAFMCIVAIGLVQATVGLSALRSMTQSVESVAVNAVMQVDSARSAWNSFEQTSALLNEELQMIERKQGSEAVTKFDELASRTDSNIQIYLRSLPVEEGRIAAETAGKTLREWRSHALVLLGTSSQTAIPSPHMLERSRHQIGEMLDRLVSLARADAGAAHVKVQATNAVSWKVLLGLALFSLLAGIGLAFVISLRIVNPLVVLKRRIKMMVDGDMASPVLGCERKDEVGSIANAIAFFREKFVERHEEEQRLKARHAELESAGREAAARAIEDERQFVKSSLGKALEKLAARDLTFRITEQLPEAYQKLRHDFNSAMDQIEDVISMVSGSTKTITSGTLEISSASDDLSRRTEQQAASLEETAASVADVTNRVRQAAAGATQARAVVAFARNEAAKGGIVVRKAIEAINGIEKSSTQITQIVGVIDEIAFQTNLLALNAGVEAARAGDSGRGFAVVAQEVRALAQRSAAAAKEIRTLIASSRAEVEQGVRLVGETGSSLDRIVARVMEINEAVNVIASSAEEQAISLAEVNLAVGQMDRSTQQNATMVEQATAAAKVLAEQSEELNQMIASFVTNARIAPEEARPGRRPANTPPAHSSNPGTSIRKLGLRRNA